jgi:hypothetical protein
LGGGRERKRGEGGGGRKGGLRVGGERLWLCMRSLIDDRGVCRNHVKWPNTILGPAARGYKRRAHPILLLILICECLEPIISQFRNLETAGNRLK